MIEVREKCCSTLRQKSHQLHRKEFIGRIPTLVAYLHIYIYIYIYIESTWTEQFAHISFFSFSWNNILLQKIRVILWRYKTWWQIAPGIKYKSDHREKHSLIHSCCVYYTKCLDIETMQKFIFFYSSRGIFYVPFFVHRLGYLGGVPLLHICMGSTYK